MQFSHGKRFKQIAITLPSLKIIDMYEYQKFANYLYRNLIGVS